ncbi:equilibrative nucleotide transporter 1-like, partial [Corylus avellana]|uniref:equilibrative nucleotide transporter 1-like n=1 Tax=Corylus avellana TaxID=13451 RepID=UPI00286BBDF5
MGVTGKIIDGDSESTLLLSAPTTTTSAAAATPDNKLPKDTFHFAYIIYFTLGCGYLLPWNAFITAVDYFDYLYPDVSVDRIFAVVYMVVGLVCLLLIILYSRKSHSFVRINVGLALFILALLVVPVMDLVYIKGQVGLYNGFYVTVAVMALCGLADALVQGGVIGAAGELPERYMQAVVAGTAASGVLISLLRIITKAIYPQDANGLRSSANLYFGVGIVVMAVCIVFHNVAHRLPVIKYYNELKAQAVNEEKEEKGPLTGPVWRATLWSIVGRVKWYALGIVLIYTVTLSIFPGYITEDVHSEILKDWYSILLITGYNVFDLVGKSL